MDQLCLPMDLEEDIPPYHLARVVNAVVNQLNDSIFHLYFSLFSDGRNSAAIDRNILL
jgi:transposase